jgi:succinate dehydrogenase / fumarate reductase iron-sulfur subunit
MVQFNLPDNSKLVKGDDHSLPDNIKNKKKISIYRWSPEDDKNPKNG